MGMRNVYDYREPLCRDGELLYLLTDGEHVKVGRTRTKLRSRVSALQTGSPRRIRAVVSVEIPGGAAEAEAYCHRILRDLNTHGEWFRCSLDEALRALVVAASPYVGRCWFVHDQRQQDKLKKAMNWHRENWHGITEAANG